MRLSRSGEPAALTLEPHGRTGNPGAIIALMKALGDSDTEVRRAAALSRGICAGIRR